MLYEQYDHDSCLTDVFHGAVSDNRNIVLQTGSLFNARKDFAESVIKSLSSRPRILECRFLYDRHGSELYEKITELPEYYPTRTEAAILEQCAAQISRITGPCTLLELGSGSSTKTDLLLSAYSNEHGPFCYAPIDVSESVLRMAGREITAKHPHIKVVGIHGTYHDAFPLFRRASPALVIFLGSTIGNFTLQETDLFWRDVIGHLQENDYFLLGIDLIKSRPTLEAAYNDRAGITARFTKNFFARMNRELDTCLDLNTIEHVAFYNEALEQVEIYAHFHSHQSLRIKNHCFDIEAGERIRVEVSRKFNIHEVAGRLRSSGLLLQESFTDKNNWFGLLLFKKVNNAEFCGSAKPDIKLI